MRLERHDHRGRSDGRLASSIVVAGRGRPALHWPSELSTSRRSFRHLRHLARFFDVQHVQEPVIQFVDTEDHGPDGAAQGFGRRLEAGFLDLDHVTDFIHQ